MGTSFFLLLNMGKEILILTDIWGSNHQKWMDHYVRYYEKKYKVIVFDVIELGEICTSDFNEEKIHTQFINFGIDKAVDNLFFRKSSALAIIGFSIGGLIAWKACLRGMVVDNLILVSSTRLRFEVEKPNCHLQLFFGSKDPYIPDTIWFNNLDIIPEIFENHHHEIYRDFVLIPYLLEKIRIY